MTDRASEGPTSNSLRGNSGTVAQFRDNYGDIHLVAEPRGSRAVLSHEERLARLSALRNLTDDRLPFVPPGPDHPSDPARLFARLRDGLDDRGVVLVGPAGSGKTRTCLEVAELARAAGWRVLHVLPGADSVEPIVSAVVAEPAPALVLVDYLSEYRGLDRADLPTWLFTEARAAGVTVAVLATARAGWMLLDEADPVHTSFDVVALRADTAHQDAVRGAILDLEAPSATHLYGRDWVERACGRRPVIAMLIAREVEAWARTGVRPADPRRGLAGWLLSRLREDGLVLPRPKRAFERVEPDTGLLVSAAVVAACPRPRAELDRVAEAVLGGSATIEDARQYVDTLLGMSWIEEDGPNLAVVHDIVVDQLLEQAMLTAPGDRVRRSVAESLLTPAVTDARTTGRYALNLARLVRELAAKGRADDLTAFCAEWLRDNATTVGRTLLDDPESGGFTLGTLLDGEPWADAALTCWADLIGPWLTRHGRTPQARHLYFKGLHVAPAERAAHLSEGAIGWLRDHGARAGAGFVLSALLAKAELGTDADTVVTTAVDWVRRHWRRVDAQYVLTGLLTRRGPGSRTTVVVEYARRWLVVHRARDDARYVLNALLDERHDLGRAAREIIGLALGWLDHHPGPESAMVLSVLLGRTDSAVPYALTWLGEHGVEPNAQYVLEPLLGERTLTPDSSDRVIRLSLRWLVDNLDRFAGGFLLNALFDGRDLTPHTTDALLLAVAWLREHAEEPVAGAVLGRLVDRSDLGAGGPVVLHAARTWLGVHHSTHTAGPLLASLLARPDAGGVLEHGVVWLTANRKHPLTGPIATLLLRHPDLGPHLTTVTAHSLRWLVSHRDHVATAELRTALAIDVPDLDFILAWLDNHADAQHAEVLLRHLLRHEDLADNDPTVTGHAMTWLHHHGLDPHAGPLIEAVLPRVNAVEHALAWLAEHHLPGRAAILRAVLTHPDLGPHKATAVDRTMDWLAEEEDIVREPHLAVLKCLLELPDLDKRAHAAAVRWLDDHDGAAGSAQILNLVVDRPDLGCCTEPVIVRALAWVRANPAHAGASAVLSKLLTRKDLGAWATRAMSYACTWIADMGTATKTRFVIGRLLARPDLGSLTPEAVTHALQWLDVNEKYPKAWFVLIPLLDVPGAHSTKAVSHARTWLGATSNDPTQRAEIESRLSIRA
ncbi:hypothetical protein [Actinokineospora enzanensis]|uniref:hypothetical protein n=1 Tax=Actinokineospora enzanensis TaxID=155975 RepID=UPI000365D523|nr:hypothetical protein [Actinokineospora enzanensis]